MKGHDSSRTLWDSYGNTHKLRHVLEGHLRLGCIIQGTSLLYVKMGMAFARIHRELWETGSTTYSKSHNTTHFSLGVGGDFFVYKKCFVRLEGTYLFKRTKTIAPWSWLRVKNTYSYPSFLLGVGGRF
jgi:opacity protein-like surface antigen